MRLVNSLFKKINKRKHKTQLQFVGDHAQL